MNVGYTLDENGQIDDNDPIYEVLDEWFESHDYNKIIDAVQRVPYKQWSNHLWLTAIHALNCNGEYGVAREELIKLYKRCQTPADKARAYALLGYGYYMESKELKALYCYHHAMKEDPDNTAALNLQPQCQLCEDAIQNEFSELRHASKNLSKRMKERVQETPEDMKMIPYDAESFALILSFLPAVRTIAGREEPLGLNRGIYANYQDAEDSEAVKQWLLEAYDIRDMETLEAAMRREFFVGRHYENFLSYKKGIPVLDLKQLDDNGQKTWEACIRFFENISAWVPDGGLSAWDISEKIGLARQAFACGIIQSDAFSSFFVPLMDEAKCHYNSWEDYFTALLLGGGFFMYFLTDFNINESIEFIENMTELVCRSNVLDAAWNDEDIKAIRFDTLVYERWIKAKCSKVFAEQVIQNYKGHDEEDKDTFFTFQIISDNDFVYICVPNTLDFYDYLHLAYNFKNGTTVFGIHNYMPSWDFAAVVANAVGINGMQYMSRGAHKLLHNIKEPEKSNITLFFRNGYLSEISFLNDFYNELQLESMDSSKYTKDFHAITATIDLEHIKALRESGQVEEITVKII
ncbi:MAG: DUF1266 domain-containing protein [Acutalibacteraceae bacterium]